MEATARPKALVVDADPLVCSVIAVTLDNAGFAVTTASCARSALKIAQEEHPVVLLTDLSTAESESLELARAVQLKNPHTRCVAMTHGECFGVRLFASAARNAGYDAMLVKPFGRRSLIEAVTVTESSRARHQPPSLTLGD
jgi:DNA-binding NtrC family response regulator